MAATVLGAESPAEVQEAQEWAEMLFESESCPECSRDENDHTILVGFPFGEGTFFARCNGLI